MNIKNLQAMPLLLLLLLSLPLFTSNATAFTNKLDSSNAPVIIINSNSTLLSQNHTFELCFFSPDENQSKYYLAIRYASIPTSPYIWIANGVSPTANLEASTLTLTRSGQLTITENFSHNDSSIIIWHTTNTEKAVKVELLETGNLILLPAGGGPPVWQSFDYPTDTWLPGMNLTSEKFLTSWRSAHDPAPGLYSLRLNPREFNEFQLVYNGGGGGAAAVVYWSTGNWTVDGKFTGVPEMTIQYIYRFHFANPYTPGASFWYTETALDTTLSPPLTRFRVDVDGQLKQYTWTQQIENWNMFWSRPENPCRVYALCGDLGVCKDALLKPCVCLTGFRPKSEYDWESEDFSSGCGRVSGDLCKLNDGFEEVGLVDFEGAKTVSFMGGRNACESECLKNCSCRGFLYDGRSDSCKIVFGSLLNLRNFSSDSTFKDDVLYVRVPREGVSHKRKERSMVLIVCVVGLAVILVVGLLGMLLILGKSRMRRKKGIEDDDGVLPGFNLKVFSYKELYAATRGFSDKLGHGGFGVVFEGKLQDSSAVAVKRLERPGSGEKEFRAEVCTIGNIQHVNLVRLRGFCSEKSHRLLVYDYMPNGPLSAYLRRDGAYLSWDVRFRVAVGTARGIAYLHEECRDCIIHCDIKPENILLDGYYTAKVSDFGLAKLVGRDFSRVLATMRGTWGYVAPEWISGVAITTKADVYSYGMTLLELLGGRRNKAPPSATDNGCREGENEERWFFPPYAAQHIVNGNVAAVVDDRLGSAYNIEEAKRVALVAIWCIQDSEEMRPTMRMVVKMLEGVVEVMTPPTPKLLQALISGESYHGVQVDSSNCVSTGRDYAEVSSCSLQSSPGNASLPVNDNVNV